MAGREDMEGASVSRVDTPSSSNPASHAGSASEDGVNSAGNTKSDASEEAGQAAGAEHQEAASVTEEADNEGAALQQGKTESNPTDRVGTQSGSRPYVTSDDVDMGETAQKKEAAQKEKGEKEKATDELKKQATKVAAAGAVKVGSKMAAMAAMKAMMKMLMMMIQTAAQAVAQAGAAALNAFVNFITGLATAIGISVTVAIGGAAGIALVAVVIIAVGISQYTSNDIASRDDAGPCDEEIVWEFSGTATGDTLEMAKTAYAFFHELGYTDTNIAGILGNWDVESGIDPTSVELVYDEPFSDIRAMEGSKKWNSWLGKHEACKCEWLNHAIDNGLVNVIQESEDKRPWIYEYKYDDPVKTYEYCWTCKDGYSVECEHGFTESHLVDTPTGGTRECTDGYEVPCDAHGIAEEHHVAVYHDIDFKMHCLDWNTEDDQSEGFDLWNTKSGYSHPYCGIGLGQWTDGRNRLLLQFAENRGVDWCLPETQLAFMIAEDGDDQYHRKWFQRWDEEPNPQQAALNFTKFWEGNTKMAINQRKEKATSWYITISEWNESGTYDAALGQSIIDMAGVTADSATNVAAGRQMESCRMTINADNSSIADAAVSFAWETKDLSYNDGTQLWQCVKDACLGANDGNGTEWKYKSCDRTVASAVRWSGADNEYPAGNVAAQAAYVMSHPDQWYRIPWDGNAETLQPGDILIKVANPHGHTIVYTGYEAIQKKYPDLPSSYQMVDGSYGDHSPACREFASSWVSPQQYDVYRCVKKETDPQYTNISCGGAAS